MVLYFWRVGYQLNSFLWNRSYLVVVVQSPSHARIFMTPWIDTHQASLCLTISCSLPKFILIVSVMSSSHLTLCHLLLLLLSIIPSIRVFSNELTLCVRWPKYWSFSISPSNEYSGLIYFRVQWFDLLTVQGIHTCCPRGSYLTVSNSTSENLCEGND